MNKNKRFIFLYWTATILWMGVIFYFSHQPGLKSELEPAWDLIFRKIAHVAEYFVLAYLFFKSFSISGIKKQNAIIASIVFAVGYAVLDEWHQMFINDRSGSLKDVLVDSIGVLFFYSLYFIYYRSDNKSNL